MEEGRKLRSMIKVPIGQRAEALTASKLLTKELTKGQSTEGNGGSMIDDRLVGVEACSDREFIS